MTNVYWFRATGGYICGCGRPSNLVMWSFNSAFMLYLNFSSWFCIYFVFIVRTSTAQGNLFSLLHWCLANKIFTFLLMTSGLFLSCRNWLVQWFDLYIWISHGAIIGPGHQSQARSLLNDWKHSLRNLWKSCAHYVLMSTCKLRMSLYLHINFYYVINVGNKALWIIILRTNSGHMQIIINAVQQVPLALL